MLISLSVSPPPKKNPLGRGKIPGYTIVAGAEKRDIETVPGIGSPNKLQWEA